MLALLRLSPTVALVALVEAVGLAVGLVVATAATTMAAAAIKVEGREVKELP